MLALLLLAASLGIGNDLIEDWSGAFFIFHVRRIAQSGRKRKRKDAFFSLFLTVQMHNRPTPFLRKLRHVNC